MTLCSDEPTVTDGRDTLPNVALPWRQASFPPDESASANLTVPAALDIPLGEIARPEQFPPFFLLGKRVDSSFHRAGDEVSIECAWPRHSRMAVARITIVSKNCVKAEEPWNGQPCAGHYRSGQTLGKGLLYTIQSLAFRDARWTMPEGVQPYEPDPRETYFAEFLKDQLGVANTPPAHGRTCIVQHPAGILRSLVIPCHAEESEALREMLTNYRSLPDAYVQPWLDTLNRSTGQPGASKSAGSW